MRLFMLMLGVFLSSLCFGGLSLEQKTREFYALLNKGDSTDLKPFFHDNSRIKHIGEANVWDISVSQFFEACAKFKSNYFSEEINRLIVTETASSFNYVDVYFDFYVKGSYSHSGLDHFCWTIQKGEVKIESVYSSDFIKDEPLNLTGKAMNIFMNNWHNNAAKGDLAAYFQFMSEDFIYLGTDPDERWTKKEFQKYCKPYFDKKSTWNFKMNWRNWYFSDDQKTAWFEESLDTQMEECRGSGVLKKQNGMWQIAHYNLSVVIENKKMKKFIKLRRK